MQQAEDHTDDRLKALLSEAVRRETQPLFEELRAFLDRRFAELSAEINATVQIVDFSETNLSSQLAVIQDQVSRMTAPPAAAAEPSGVELEAIVQATEDAATRILEAAEAIDRWAGSHQGETPQAVKDKLGAIFAACGFQDLTGQRIRRAIANLEAVQGRIAALAQGAAPALPEAAPAPAGPALKQGEVDKLFERR